MFNMRLNTIIQNQPRPPLSSIWPAADRLSGPREQLQLFKNSNKTKWPFFSSCYDFPFTVGPNVFFLAAAGCWALGFRVLAGFLVLGCRELRPSISQYLLHWCNALNWSMKEVAQFPLKPLYLEQINLLLVNPLAATHRCYWCVDWPFFAGGYSHVGELHPDAWISKEENT